MVCVLGLDSNNQKLLSFCFRAAIQEVHVFFLSGYRENLDSELEYSSIFFGVFQCSFQCKVRKKVFHPFWLDQGGKSVRDVCECARLGPIKCKLLPLNERKMVPMGNVVPEMEYERDPRSRIYSLACPTRQHSSEFNSKSQAKCACILSA